jgi:hypothetical protein
MAKKVFNALGLQVQGIQLVHYVRIGFHFCELQSCEEGAIVALFCCPAGHNMCLTW